MFNHTILELWTIVLLEDTLPFLSPPSNCIAVSPQVLLQLIFPHLQILDSTAPEMKK